MGSTELTEALVEVIKAYRLVAVYQRRILDIAKTIQLSLEYKQYYYCNNDYDINKNNILPTEQWSLAMLPLYTGLSMFYYPQKADPNIQNIDEWMLEIRFYNDSGFDNQGGVEPKPENFDPPEECKSRMLLCAYGTKIAKEGFCWRDNVLNITDYPVDGDMKEEPETYSIGRHYDLALIGSEADLNIVIDDFKKLVKTKRNELGLEQL